MHTGTMCNIVLPEHVWVPVPCTYQGTGLGVQVYIHVSSLGLKKYIISVPVPRILDNYQTIIIMATLVSRVP